MTVSVRLAAEMAVVSRERMTRLVGPRLRKIRGERTAAGHWRVDVEDLKRWIAERDMKRAEDTAHGGGEPESSEGPDPRNVDTVVEWDNARCRLRHVTRNFEERAAFAFVTGMGNPAMPEWAADPNTATVGEIRRLGLSDVSVVCPRNVVENGFVVHTRGEVIDWATAAMFDVVKALPAGWSAWRGVA